MSDSVTSFELVSQASSPLPRIDDSFFREIYGAYFVHVGYAVFSNCTVDNNGQRVPLKLPSQVRKILTPELLCKFIVFHHMMYESNSQCRQPILRFTAVNKAGQKVLIEGSFSNGAVVDNILTFQTSLYDERHTAEPVNLAVVTLRTSPQKDKRIGRDNWFDTQSCGIRFGKVHGRYCIHPNELNGNFSSIFAEKIGRKFNLINDVIRRTSFEDDSD
jgi:hypothetical protein